ncbi:hypothetical protein ACIQC5_09470 [Paenarthrobacter sp. NPDC092416]|uniref:hypothetical protein n=1 Tax=Paenarthrobacter sp. NPDC092416 TaxID=3364386 RepID=UPI0037FF6DDC
MGNESEGRRPSAVPAGSIHAGEYMGSPLSRKEHEIARRREEAQRKLDQHLREAEAAHASHK